MKIIQRSTKINGPTIILTPISVVDVEGVITPFTHRDFVFNSEDGADSHYDYTITGQNTEELSLVSSTYAVDFTSYPPLIKRTEDSRNHDVNVVLSVGSYVTTALTLDFNDKNGEVIVSNPQSIVPGSYAEYSWNRVNAIYSQLPAGGHQVFDPTTKQRININLPHSEITGQMLNHVGAYGYSDHLRWFAITKRHVIGISHNGPSEETTLPGGAHFRSEWRTIDNQPVFRNQVTSWIGPVNMTGFVADIRIILLDENLPNSIKPLKVAGDWFYRMNFDTMLACPQGFGLYAFGRDYHLCPAQYSLDYDYNMDPYPPAVVGDDVTPMEDYYVFNFLRSVNLEGYEHYNCAIQGTPFYHETRSGDSGSCVLIPVANNEWAIAAMLSGSMLSASYLNKIITWVDEKAFAADLITEKTGYTVTVAENPLG